MAILEPRGRNFPPTRLMWGTPMRCLQDSRAKRESDSRCGSAADDQSGQQAGPLAPRAPSAARVHKEKKPHTTVRSETSRQNETSPDTSQVFGPRGAGIGRLGTREQQTHVRALGERRPLQTTQALTATLLQRVRDCSDFTNGEDTAEYNSGGGTASQSCIPQPWGSFPPPGVQMEPQQRHHRRKRRCIVKRHGCNDG
ncbi:hypothetical protein CGCA056_v014977 [Colletotrichum aenigma]|uniref:uncharacterized protein n=1 Tax=Colletotrichum aenigma TaxID=1215731 RepID=UPI0018730F37|nr:uncharacterized protein CGCA056_v014977 [Colletotrichum aenigma]KAF5500024.1 hypothetical protein CGCA056_v014977 [Colletotrichum aenigma]